MADIQQLITAIAEDYRNFPQAQSYHLYAKNVYFKDPMNEFQGVDRYKTMIGFMETWFRNIQLDLHQIQAEGDRIRTDWTLSWTTPLPWQPRISINGWSELAVNADGLITSHIDYWHCSRWDVLTQHFSSPSAE